MTKSVKSHPIESCPNCGFRILPQPEDMKALRIAAGLTQRRMAELLNVADSYVTFLEMGKRKPSADICARWFKLAPMLKERAKKRIAEFKRTVAEGDHGEQRTYRTA